MTQKAESCAPPTFAARAIGWGGWTRTNTILINSEVSYRLDHAPTLTDTTIRYNDLLDVGGHGLGLLGCAGVSCGVSWTFRVRPGQPLNGS